MIVEVKVRVGVRRRDRLSLKVVEVFEVCFVVFVEVINVMQVDCGFVIVPDRPLTENTHSRLVGWDDLVAAAASTG
jgi:hypothetical protein